MSFLSIGIAISFAFLIFCVMNCSLRDTLFSYMRPLLDVYLSSEQMPVSVLETAKNGIHQRF